MRSGMMLALVLSLLGSGFIRAQEPGNEQWFGEWATTNQAVREKMRQRTDIEVTDILLPALTAHWQKRYGINIALSPKLNARDVKAKDIRVNLLLSNVPLDSSLSLMLAGYDLGWYIDQKQLIITTEEDANTRMTLRAYHLGGLNAEKVIRGIQTTPDPEAWEQHSGRGRITKLTEDNILFVWQNQREHDRIRALLRQMTKSQGNPFGTATDQKRFGDPPPDPFGPPAR